VINNVTKDVYFKEMQFFSNQVKSNNPECIMVSTKILSSTTVFNIDDNKKCKEISILE